MGPKLPYPIPMIPRQPRTGVNQIVGSILSPLLVHLANSSSGPEPGFRAQFAGVSGDLGPKSGRAFWKSKTNKGSPTYWG